jgi:hypothetical protein
MADVGAVIATHVSAVIRAGAPILRRREATAVVATDAGRVIAAAVKTSATVKSGG